jgi:hypothetical protein
VFYVICVHPDLQPQRVKLGWTARLSARLGEFRPVAPFAHLLRSWPCARPIEQPAIQALTLIGCVRIGPELFDCDDIEALLTRADDYFARAGQRVTMAPGYKRARRKHAGSIREYRPGRFVGQVMLGYLDDGRQYRPSVTGDSAGEVSERLAALIQDYESTHRARTATNSQLRRLRPRQKADL